MGPSSDVVAPLLFPISTATWRTDAPTCLHLLSLAVLSAVAITTPAAARLQPVRWPAAAFRLGTAHRPRGRRRQRQAGQARVCQSLRTPGFTAEGRSEPCICLAESRNGCQRPLRLRGSSGWFVQHHRRRGERIRATARRRRRHSPKGERWRSRFAWSDRAPSRAAFKTRTATGCSARRCTRCVDSCWRPYNPGSVRSFGNDKRSRRVPSLQPACRRVLRPGDVHPSAGRYDDPAPPSGYANTYYPGSPALRGARGYRARRSRQRGRELHARTLPACKALDQSRRFSRRPSGPGSAGDPHQAR